MGGSRGGIGLRTAVPASADALRLKGGAPQVRAKEDLCLTPRPARTLKGWKGAQGPAIVMNRETRVLGRRHVCTSRWHVCTLITVARCRGGEEMGKGWAARLAPSFARGGSNAEARC